MKQLIKAIFTKAKANSTLYNAVGSDFFYEQVPPRVGTSVPSMPWIIFTIQAQLPHHTFAGEWEDAIVRFLIFDDSSNVDPIETVYSDLNLLFNRATLTYDSFTHIGCIREGSEGPIKTEDGWMHSVDYRVRYT